MLAVSWWRVSYYITILVGSTQWRAGRHRQNLLRYSSFLFDWYRSGAAHGTWCCCHSELLLRGSAWHRGKLARKVEGPWRVCDASRPVSCGIAPHGVRRGV